MIVEVEGNDFSEMQDKACAIMIEGEYTSMEIVPAKFDENTIDND